MDRRRGEDTGVAVAGVVLAGGSVGLPYGALATARTAVQIPVIVVAVLLLTVPALYIGAAYLGVAPRARGLGEAVRRGIQGGGVYLLGLFPAVAFLLCTATQPDVEMFVSVAVAAAGTGVGLHAMHGALFTEGRRRVLSELFLLWALLALGIGAVLFFDYYPTARPLAAAEGKA